MSVSLYRWTPECDMSVCPGDCDLCIVELMEDDDNDD